MSKTLQRSLSQQQCEGVHREVGNRVPRVAPAITLVALLSMTAFAAWLRLRGLAAPNLWLDEAYSVLFAHMNAGQFWKVMWSREGNMLLYYVFLRPWVHLGDTEFMLRIPSVIFAAASIPAIYVVGRDLFGSMAGMIAAALLSVHMFHVFLSRQARSYSLLLLLLLFSCWLFIKFSQAPQHRLYMVSYAVVSALAVYAHIFALLVIGSQWLLLIGERGRRVGWRRIGAVVALIFVLALPMEAFLVLKNKGQLDWVPPLSTSTFLDGMHAIAGYGNVWLSGLYIALAVLAIAAGARTDDAFALRVVESWLGFPLVIMLFYSLHKPVFHSRFLLICVPALILLAAQGVVAIVRWRPEFAWVSAGIVLLLIGLSLKTTSKYLNTPTCADWNPATHFVLANARADDAICFAGTGAEVFLYYMQGEKHLPWRALPNPRYSHGARCFGNSPENVASLNSAYQRAWLIKTDSSTEQYEWISRLLSTRFSPPIRQGSFGCPVGKITIELLP